MNLNQVNEAKWLDSWPRIKALRSEQVKEMWGANERGDLLIWSSPIPYTSFIAGFGNYSNTGGLGPNYTKVMMNRPLLDECMQKVDEAGYSTNVCGMFRTTLGQILGGVYDTSLVHGKKANIDVFFDFHVCQGQIKSFPLWRKYYPGINYVGVEMPYSYEHVEYFILQLHEAVDSIERATGRRYNDELAIEAFRVEWEVHRYAAMIVELQKNRPAPMNARWLTSLNSCAVARAGAHKPKVLEVYKLVYEEVKDRVAKGIGAIPNERVRLIHEGVSSWYPSAVLRFPNSFGATFVMNGQNACGMGSWVPSDTSSHKVVPTLGELGIKIETRDDLFRAMGDCWLKYMRQVNVLEHYPSKINQVLNAVEEWDIDGVVISRSMECRGLSGMAEELARKLKENGIPAMVYEGSPNTPLEFNQEKYKAQMTVFLEGFGLKPIPDFQPVEPEDYFEF